MRYSFMLTLTCEARGKGEKTMPRKASNDFKRNVKVLDENFDSKTIEVAGTFNPADSYEKALEMFGNDQGKILDALNSVLKAQAIQAQVEAKTAGAFDERFVMKFIKTFRSVPPFNAIEKESEQTKAILEQIKTVPFLLQSLKDFVKAQAEEGDSEEE